MRLRRACGTKCSRSAQSPGTSPAFSKSIPSAPEKDIRRVPAFRRNSGPGRAGAVRRSRSARSCRKSRSEEHTSELQSRLHLVCRLLLEKKKKKINKHHILYSNTR